MPTKSAIALPTSPSQIYAQAPCRADLAGSTIDLWPLYLFHPGSVTVNMAVNIQTSCKITPCRGRGIHLKSVDTGREDRFSSLAALLEAKRYRHALAAYLVRFFQPKQGFLLETHSESPAGAGISGSSAMMICTSAALARFVGRDIDIEQIRVIAQNVEAQLIRVPTGCQDYYPAMYGGVNAIHLDPDGIHCEPIAIDPQEVNKRFVLVYTGAPRQSGINNWEVFKQHINGDKHVIRNFAEISRIAGEMRVALKSRDWTGCRAPAQRRVETPPHQRARHHYPTHRQIDCRSQEEGSPRSQGLRRWWRRLRYCPYRRGFAWSSRRLHSREWWTGTGLPYREQRPPILWTG